MVCVPPEEGGKLDAGSTPRMPLPVPKPGGCGGRSALAVSGLDGSVLAVSVLAISVFPLSTLAITALDVSGKSERAGGTVLVTGATGWDGPAAASFIGPALT